jgi:L-amino acid N-acyltransferase YncA
MTALGVSAPNLIYSPRHAIRPRMSIVIRPAVTADLPAITTIYGHAVTYGTATFEIDPPDEAEMGERFRAIVTGGFPYLVACAEDGRTVGYAYAGLYRTRFAYRHTLEDSIYIDPAFHRRGVGRALLDRLMAESEARGFRQMVAVIGDSAQIPSIALHHAAGFRMVGTFEAIGFKFDRWLDTVMMQRALGAGAQTMP